MKKIYHRLAALGMAAAALSSCSRAAYTFNPQTPAYLGTTRPVAAPREAAAASVAAPVPVAVATAPASHVASRPAPAPHVAEVAGPVATLASQPAPKLTLVQRLALKKVVKQLAKAETRQQNTAGIAKTAARGPGITVGIVGLAALVVGLIVSSGFLIVAGSIVLAVGIVLYVLSIL